MDPILGILLIALGVLDVIFFIKIWGATNDIKALKEKYVNNDCTFSAEEVFRLHLLAKDKEAFDYLNDCVSKEILNIRNSVVNSYGTSEDFEKKLKSYLEDINLYYKNIGYNMPDDFKTITFDSFEKW